jgi:hypothetical protein
MSSKQWPRVAGMRPSANDAGHRNRNIGVKMICNKVTLT